MNPYLSILDSEPEPEAPETPAAPREPAPPPVQRDENPYRSIVQADEQQQDQGDGKLRRLFELGLQVPPDRRAGVLYVSRETGVPPEIVESQYELFQQRAEAAKFDPQRFRQENPGLVDLLLTDPAAASVVMTDEQMSGAKRVLRGLTRFVGDHPFLAGPGSNAFGLGFSTGEIMDIEDQFLGREPSLESRKVTLPEPQQVATKRSSNADTRGLDRLAIYAEQYGYARDQAELNSLGSQLLFAEVHGDDTYELEKRVLELQQKTKYAPYYAQGPVEQVLLDGVDALGSQMSSLKGSAAGVAGGVAAAGVLALVTRQPGLFGPAARVMGGGGAAVGAFLSSAVQETGSAYLDIRATKTDQGEVVDRELARGAAVTYGLLAAGVEVAALGVLWKALGPLGTAIRQGGGKAALRAMMADRTKAQIFREVGKAYVKGALSEGAEEGVQQALQHLATYGAKVGTAGGRQRFGAEDFVTSIAESSVKGLIGGAFLAAAPSSINIASQLSLLESSQKSAATIAAIAKLPESNAARAAPVLVARIIENEAAKSGQSVEALYADAPSVVRLFQSQGVNPDEALTELMGPEGPTQLKEALAGANNGRLEIPLTQFLEKWGTKPGIAEALAPDLATRPGFLTTREMNEVMKADPQFIKKLADGIIEAEERAAEEGRRIEPQSAEEERLVRAIEAQLIQTGVTSAKQARTAIATTKAFARVMADSFKLPVEQLFAHHATKVERLVEESAQANAAAQPLMQGEVRQARLEEIGEELQKLYDARVRFHLAEQQKDPARYESVSPADLARDEIYAPRGLYWDVRESVQAARLRAERGRLEPARPTAAIEVDPSVVDPRVVLAANLSPQAQALAERIALALEDEGGPAPDAEVVPPPATQIPSAELAKELGDLDPGIQGAILKRRTQVQNLPEWELKVRSWMANQGYKADEIERHVAGIRGQMKIFQALGPVELSLLPRGRGKNEGPKWTKDPSKAGTRETAAPHGPLRSNEDDIYQLSFDLSAMCVKRLEAAATATYIEQKLNRALTTSERTALVALFKLAGKTAPCLYCYVEAPRAKSAELVTKAMDIAWGKLSIPEAWAETTKELARNAIAEVQKLGLKPSDVDATYFTDPEVADQPEAQGRKAAAPATYAFMDQMARSVTVNKPKLFEEYTGEILDVPDKLIEELNSYAGFRFFSSSDFQAEHVADLMQAFFDLELRGARSHAYTKVVDYVEIFGATGQKIQTSIFAKRDEQGRIVEDDWQGMKWADAKRLRKKFANVGTVLVATDDEMVRWALDQDWVDYIIPFHHSGMESRFFKEMGWKSFQSVQSETWADPKKEGKPPKVRMHELRAEHGVSDEELTKRYLKIVKERGLAPVFPQFADHPRFAKLKKDYARTDSPFQAVRASFDLKAADRVLKKFLAGDAPKAAVDTKIANVLLDLIEKMPEGADVGVEMLRQVQAQRDTVQIGRRLNQPAWHGSPHRNVDRFSTSKIGTGQGAQSYGWGLYFAEQKEVAEQYRRELSDTTPHFKALTLEENDRLPSWIRERIRSVGKPALDELTRDFTERLQNAIDQQKTSLQPWLAAEQEANMRRILDSLGKIAREGSYESERGKGQLYKVEVPESSELLDRDKPMSQQPAGIVEKLKTIAPLMDVMGELGLPDSLTGEGVYMKLAAILGSDRAASEALNAAGIPGLQYLDAGSRGKGKKQTHNYVVWNDEAVAILDRLYQSKKTDQKTVRAWVDVIRQGLNKVFKITLTERSDLSSFLHESAHTFLEMLLDMSEHPDAPQRVKVQAADALKWLGAGTRGDLTVEMEERWARAFEAYLLEGKAPSAQLVKAFQTFRLWLLEIYKSITGLNVTLDDEIRSVFDRLLATDQEIEAMKRATGRDRPLFRSPEEGGMTPEQYQAYLEEREQSFQQAALQLARRVLRDRSQATEAWWKEGLKKAVEAAREAWDRRPDVRALAYVKRGELVTADGRKISDNDLGKLDREAVAAAIGGRRVEVVKGERKVVSDVPPDLVKLLHGRLVKEGGESPDDVAKRYGYATGRELLEALRQVPDREEWSAEEGERRMRAAHPDILEEKTRLAEEAAAALHNEGTSDWLLKEFVALGQKAGIGVGQQGGRTPAEAIRLAAQEMARSQKVRTLNSQRALDTERRAAEAAAVAAAKGDFKLAFIEKQKQLLHHYLYRELEAARAARDKFEDLGKRLSDRDHRETLARAGKIFIDAAEQILEAMGFKEPERDPEVLAARKTLPEVMKELDNAGIIPAFAGHMLSQLVAHPPQAVKGPAWKELSISDMWMVGSALSQLYTAARDANAVIHEGKRVLVDSLAADIAREAAKRPDKGSRPGSDTAAPLGYWAKQRIEGFNAALADPEVLFEELGPTATKFFWDRYLAQRELEYRLSEKVSKFFVEHWDKLPPEMQRRRYDLVDASALPFPADLDRNADLRDRQWVWMVALNMGNRGNMERLLGGYQWNEKQVRDFLEATITDEEWTFLESVWELMDRELWPEVAKAYEAVNGIRPEKIEALPFTLASGRVIRGGYFPARYDPVASRVGQNQAIEDVQKLYAQRAGAVSVSKSFTKERVKEYTDVINLQWSFVPSHVANVIHYVAFDQFTRDAARVLFHGQTQQAIAHFLGAKYQGQLKGWLQTVASAHADAIPETLEDTYYPFVEARSRFVISTLGYSLTVALGDFTNPLVAIAAGAKHGGVSASYMVPALLRALRPMLPWVKESGFAGMRADAVAKSKELPSRASNMKVLLRQQLAELGRQGKKGRLGHMLEATRQTAWFFMEWTDKLTSTVIWEGAYREALAKAPGDEAAAIKRADAAVRAMLPGHELAEMPAFLRDRRGMGALVAFYGYFNKLYNVRRRIWRDAYEDWGTAEGVVEKGKVLVGGEVAAAAGRTLAMFFVANVVGELLTGRGPEEDEPEEEWILRKLLVAPFLTIPLIGSVMEPAVNAAVAKAFHGKTKWRSFSVRASPALGAVEKLVRSIERAIKKGEPDEYLWALLEAFGLLAKTPLGSSQVVRTGRYLTGELAKDVEQGRWEDVMQPIYGPERKQQPANPVTIFTREEGR